MKIIVGSNPAIKLVKRLGSFSSESTRTWHQRIFIQRDLEVFYLIFFVSIIGSNIQIGPREYLILNEFFY